MTVDVKAYLDRIEFPGRPNVDLATLTALQRCHLGSVAFENLNVYHQTGVAVGLDWSVPKVLGGRGGWCFEANGAFGALLRSIGFDVDYVGARVLLEDEHPLDTHLTLLVHLDEDYLVDVGFGDSVTRPLPVMSSNVVAEDQGDYRLRLLGESEDREPQYLLEFRPHGDEPWAPQYRVALTPRELDHFQAGSDFLYTDATGHFRQKPFATRLFPGGRVTLLKDRIKIRELGETRETPVAAEDWSAELLAWFGMRLD